MNRSEKKSETVCSWKIVFPNDANSLGTMFGGQVMAEMDMCSAIAASKFCGSTAVTASTDALDFKNPVYIGDFLEISARVVYTGKKSMVVRTDVFSENPYTQERLQCTTAYFTMVALDKNKNSCPVPQLLLETEAEEKEYIYAQKVKNNSLQRKQKEKN